MNLETFNNTVAPTIGKFRMTTKGYNLKYNAQSVYKSELPTYDYRRFFLIADNVYELPIHVISSIYDVFDKKHDIGKLIYRINATDAFVNVPFNNFILVNEMVTNNLYQNNIIPGELITSVERIAELQSELMVTDDKFPDDTLVNYDNTLQTSEDFYNFVSDTLYNCEHTLISKGKEYTEYHWLENLEEACMEKYYEVNLENILEILDGYRLKHKVSINKIKRDTINGKIADQSLINEKYGDYINFMIMEQAIISKYNYMIKYN